MAIATCSVNDSPSWQDASLDASEKFIGSAHGFGFQWGVSEAIRAYRDDLPIHEKVTHIIFGVTRACIGLPFFCLGGALKAAALTLKGRVNLYKPAEPCTTMPNPKKFKIATFNIAALPEIVGGLKYYWGQWDLDPVHMRMENICGTILATRADVICLQESFIPALNQWLFEELKDVYPYMLADNGPKFFLQQSSGLVILSKYPLTNPGFEEFKDSVGDEKWASKGVLWADLSLPGDKTLTIIDTHLHQGFSDARKTARDNQVMQIQALHDIHVKGSNVALLAGDFNMNAGQQQPWLTVAMHTYTPDPKAIDYVMTMKKEDSGVPKLRPPIETQSISKKKTSDHDPVIVELDLTQEQPNTKLLAN